MIKSFYKYTHIYVYKRVCPLTNSLTQQGLGDSMVDWIMNFGAQIGLKS